MHQPRHNPHLSYTHSGFLVSRGLDSFTVGAPVPLWGALLGDFHRKCLVSPDLKQVISLPSSPTAPRDSKFRGEALTEERPNKALSKSCTRFCSSSNSIVDFFLHTLCLVILQGNCPHHLMFRKWGTELTSVPVELHTVYCPLHRYVLAVRAYNPASLSSAS